MVGDDAYFSECALLTEERRELSTGLGSATTFVGFCGGATSVVRDEGSVGLSASLRRNDAARFARAVANSEFPAPVFVMVFREVPDSVGADE